jgi:hypothetical protein
MPVRFPAGELRQTKNRAAMMSNGHGEGLGELPGFSALAPDLQQLLRAAETGDASERTRLLERVADVLNVFIGLDLLQYVFMPSDEREPATAGIEIDLIAPDEADSAAIAWFSIDEAGHDEYRDAVTMFGDIADVLNPPIVLDVNDDAEEDLPRGD